MVPVNLEFSEPALRAWTMCVCRCAFLGRKDLDSHHCWGKGHHLQLGCPFTSYVRAVRGATPFFRCGESLMSINA